MKRPELCDSKPKPEQGVSESRQEHRQEQRPGRRSRHEQECRQLASSRRAQLAADFPDDGQVEVGGAPGERVVEEHAIGAESLPSPRPVAGKPRPDDTVAELAGPAMGIGAIMATPAAPGAEALAEALTDDAPQQEFIIGGNDRAHHLALVQTFARTQPYALAPSRTADPLFGPLRPSSRAECRRRCGKADTCDPSSELGCGGEYCGLSFAAARESL